MKTPGSLSIVVQLSLEFDICESRYPFRTELSYDTAVGHFMFAALRMLEHHVASLKPGSSARGFHHVSLPPLRRPCFKTQRRSFVRVRAGEVTSPLVSRQLYDSSAVGA